MEHLACQPVYPLDTITEFTGFLVLVHVLESFLDFCMLYRPFDNILTAILITEDINSSSTKLDHWFAGAPRPSVNWKVRGGKVRGKVRGVRRLAGTV